MGLFDLTLCSVPQKKLHSQVIIGNSTDKVDLVTLQLPTAVILVETKRVWLKI
jgi:hypothetical protein